MKQTETFLEFENKKEKTVNKRKHQCKKVIRTEEHLQLDNKDHKQTKIAALLETEIKNYLKVTMNGKKKLNSDSKEKGANNLKK